VVISRAGLKTMTFRRLCLQYGHHPTKCEDFWKFGSDLEAAVGGLWFAFRSAGKCTSRRNILEG
jgi:hypothetical protein